MWGFTDHPDHATLHLLTLIFLLVIYTLLGKGRAIKENRKLFWNLFFQRSKISTAIKLLGGGG